MSCPRNLKPETRNPMLKVGLTGGIASGKTYVANALRDLGCEVSDADVVARAIVEPGQPAYQEIVQAFGPEILHSDGTLDRAKLGAIIFADEPARLQLNAITHPRVHEAQSRWLAEVAERNPKTIAIIDSSLMIESGGYKKFDKIIVVYCSLEIQLERLMARNNLPCEEAMKRIAAQMPASEKLKYADYSVETSGGFESTDQQVRSLYIELEKQAQKT